MLFVRRHWWIQSLPNVWPQGSSTGDSVFPSSERGIPIASEQIVHSRFPFSSMGRSIFFGRMGWDRMGSSTSSLCFEFLLGKGRGFGRICVKSVYRCIAIPDFLCYQRLYFFGRDEGGFCTLFVRMFVTL